MHGCPSAMTVGQVPPLQSPMTTAHQIAAGLTRAGPRDRVAGLAGHAAPEPRGAGEVLLAGGAHRARQLARRPHAGGGGRAATAPGARLTRRWKRRARRRVAAIEVRGALQGLLVALRPRVAVHHRDARRCGHLMVTQGPGRARDGARLPELRDGKTRGAHPSDEGPASPGTTGWKHAAALTLEVLVAGGAGGQRSGDVADCRHRATRAAQTADRASACFQRIGGESAARKRHPALADLLEAPAQASDLAGGQRRPCTARAVVERVVVVPAGSRRGRRRTAAARLARGHGERARPRRDECPSKHASTPY